MTFHFIGGRHPSAVIKEHRHTFNYKGKSTFAGKGKGPAKAKKQCVSIKFFCLGSPEDEKPPTSVSAKTSLSSASLGPASLTLEVDEALHQRLLETYPPLVDAGGYELLLYQRGGQEQGFHPVPAPHVAGKVKGLANQATVYIRPLQLDIGSVPLMDSSSEVICFAYNLLLI